jgi:hypothetical protein
MKQLIIILSIFTLGYISACAPARNLEANFPPLESFKAYYAHDLGGPCKCSKCLGGVLIHEQILVTLGPMGVAHSRYAQAIVRNDSCIAHLDSRGRPLKQPIRVWDCDTAKKRRAK